MQSKMYIIDFVYRGVVMKIEYVSLLFVKIRYFFRVSYCIRQKETKLLSTMKILSEEIYGWKIPTRKRL